MNSYLWCNAPLHHLIDNGWIHNPSAFVQPINLEVSLAHPSACNAEAVLFCQVAFTVDVKGAPIPVFDICCLNGAGGFPHLGRAGNGACLGECARMCDYLWLDSALVLVSFVFSSEAVHLAC